MVAEEALKKEKNMEWWRWVLFAIFWIVIISIMIIVNVKNKD
jgi:hypothetical protein